MVLGPEELEAGARGIEAEVADGADAVGPTWTERDAEGSHGWDRLDLRGPLGDRGGVEPGAVDGFLDEGEPVARLAHQIPRLPLVRVVPRRQLDLAAVRRRRTRVAGILAAVDVV